MMNTVLFGRYPQNDLYFNTPDVFIDTPIEWYILDRKNGKTLLFSKYCLSVKPFNCVDETAPWSECSLRNWLNNDFMNVAFTLNERHFIAETIVSNESGHGYLDWGVFREFERHTKDKIFLLSYGDAIFYLHLGFIGGDGSRLHTSYTGFAKAEGAFWNSICPWWLRSPGLEDSETCAIDNYSRIFSVQTASKCIGVRPALWIHMDVDDDGNLVKHTECTPVSDSDYFRVLTL